MNETLIIEEGLQKLNETENAVLLDVRSTEEYHEGHLEGSLNIPINRLPTISLPKETPIFVYCLSGARSKRAADFLNKIGYTATNIGGIAGYHGRLVL
ncbi:hypothetical protein HMPREF9477_00987 [Lachnospiraceae bacterium 2_1_46FAA]|nr:hypothetical protein HMPREF9477_00987 [Lachnospiraceae bacterium 2_1_46FAA]